MKKRIMSLLLCIVLLMPCISVNATIYSSFKTGDPFQVPENPRQIPEDIYQEPYMPLQNIVVYAPWLKNYTVMKKEEFASGVYGGDGLQLVYQMDISPVNPDIIYFGTDTSSVYKTTNGGKTWYNVENHTGSALTRGLLCDPFDENIVYAAFTGTGFFRSKDGARTWEWLIKDTESQKVGGRGDNIVADGEGNCYFASGSGIWRLDRETDKITNLTPQFQNLTGDNGITWYDMAISKDGQFIYACAVESHNNDLESGIYASYDAGKTWQIIGNDESRVCKPYSLAIHPEDKNHIFFAASYTDRTTGKTTTNALYESFDAGKTSEAIHENIYENLPEGVKATPAGIRMLQFGPKRDNGEYALYYSGNQCTYPLRVSYDYGRTFKRVFEKKDNLGGNTIRENETGWWAQAFDINDFDPDHLVFGASGVYETRGEGFTRISSGFIGSAFVDFTRDKQGRAFIPTMDCGAYISDGEFTPEKFPTAYELPAGIEKIAKAIVDPSDDDHVVCYIGRSNGSADTYGIRQSFDFGDTLNEMNPDTAIPQNQAKYGNAQVLEYDVDNPDIIYMSYHNSYDNGKTWVKNEIDGQEAFWLDIQNSNPNRIIAITGTDEATKLYLSEDRGKTWKFIISPGFSNFYAAIISEDNNNEIWFTNKYDMGKIYIDSGAKLVQEKLLDYPYFHHLAQNPDNPKHWLVGSYNIQDTFGKFMVAETLDGGVSWHVVPGLWGTEVNMIKFIEGTTSAFFGTMGGLMIYDYAEYSKYLNSKVKITLDGKEVSYSEQPKIVNGRTMVPMRELFEQLGAKVNYNDQTRLITASKDGTYVSLTPGSDKATINGKEVALDASPFITEKGRTMVPLRFVSEALSVGVGWNSETRTVYIKHRK